MDYSVYIQVYSKSKKESSSFEIQTFFYYNENYDGNLYEDVLENTTDKYSIVSLENEFASRKIEENVYNASKYLVEIPHSFINVISDSNKSDFISDLFDKYIVEIKKEKKEKILQKLFFEIENFTKKYCINNLKYGNEEWIEIILPASIIGEININGIYEILNGEDGFKENEYISIFYYKDCFGLIEASYENPNKDNLTLNSSISFEEINDLDETSYSLIYYKKADILNFFVSHFHNYVYFNECVLELQNMNDLVLKISKASKKFEE